MFTESRGAAGVRAAGRQDPAEDQERGDSNSGEWNFVVVVISERREHSSEQKVSYRARDSTLVRCANMLCEKFFISGFIASTWGYDLPLPGVISPPLLAPDALKQIPQPSKHISTFVLSNNAPPSFLSI